jgi:hypothetical protein
LRHMSPSEVAQGGVIRVVRLPVDDASLGSADVDRSRARQRPRRTYLPTDTKFYHKLLPLTRLRRKTSRCSVTGGIQGGTTRSANSSKRSSWLSVDDDIGVKHFTIEVRLWP